ncbi:hypothetical protein GCM10020367_06940 [Streptomyces sannanensis]|uniref:Fe2OG dioxygenase domain-containing protein n=2 Tax=Streptomyces sannanensis TaxID=285536 RepID=A0ABP6S5Q9_9ACTN
MCGNDYSADDIGWGILLSRGEVSNAYLWRSGQARGYCVVIYTGRHVAEPTELTEAEATAFWLHTLALGRAIEQHYRPLKMNYQLLGDAIPHAHTHVVPRYQDDPAAGGPLPFTLLDPWIYLECGAGQYITPHADGIAPDPLTRPRQIAAATVTLTDIHDTGGAFYVETTGSDAAWTADEAPTGSGYAPGMRFAHDGTDMSSPWFRSMPRTRWSVAPAPGTLMVFGSQLAHGTEPVRAGRVRKFLTLFVSE